MADNPEIEFGVHPLEWMHKRRRSARVVVDYLDSPASGFDRLGAISDPTQITAIDLLRVSQLGDPLPTEAIRWLLSDEGRWLTAEILADIPPYLALRDPHPTAPFRCSDLLSLLRSRTSQIPPGDGPALRRKTSIRLLAAKRPALVPLDDKVLRTALDAPKDDDWWKRWRYVMTTETIERASEIRELAAEADPFARELPILRIVDIVVRGRSMG